MMVKPQNTRVSDVKDLYDKIKVDLVILHDKQIDLKNYTLGKYTYIGKTKRLDPFQKSNSRVYASFRNVLACLRDEKHFNYNIYVLVRPSCTESELVEMVKGHTHILNIKGGNKQFCAALYVITTTDTVNNTPTCGIKTGSLLRPISKHMFSFLNDLKAYSTNIVPLNIPYENIINVKIGKLKNKIKETHMTRADAENTIKQLEELINEIKKLKL